ncbi:MULTISPECIES: Ig-like domain-containing protein [unclassified Microbacterium]|uniref:Ig-like domain-containing protein n=1 Tax=Microbacterium TaxID=33882 RepID=UPI003BA3B0FC
MKAWTRLRARRKTLIGTAVVTAATLAIGTMAFAYDGNPTTEVDLHDGSVWITRSSSLLVGHFNHESRLLDGSLRTTSERYDIRQDGGNVLVVDEADAAVAVVNPSTVSLGDRVELPGNARVELGGDTVAILDPESGDLFVAPVAALGGFDPAEAEPVAELGEGAAVTVGLDGTVHAVSPKKGIVTVPVTAEGEPGEPEARELDLEKGAELSITSVGDRAVVLDRSTGVVHLDDGTEIEVPGGKEAALALDAAAASSVTAATASELVTIPLDGSEIVSAPSGAGPGDPVEPVVLGGCAYAAWAGAGQFLRDCAGDAHDLSTAVQDYDSDGELVFRVNRDVVMLNDSVSGAAWLASDSMLRVDNWDELTPPDDGDEEQEEETTEETLETTLPERSEENTVPIAADDRFGVRAGRTTIIPVLDNDSDPDGDVLTVSLPDGSPDFADVQLIHNGTSLQVAVPEGRTGSGSFTYQVDDGREGRDRATVRIDVHPESQNAGPEQTRTPTVAVETGGTVTYDVMPDWRDDDGDDTYLVDVFPAEGDEADFTSDGRITYRAISGAQGPLEVEVVVSDGRLAQSGTLKLDVRPAGSAPPVTNADHVVVRLGQQATVSPLANDISASIDPLRLTRVDEEEGLIITPDFSDKTFTVEGTRVGTRYVQYLAASGADGVPGLVRVDVVADEGSDLPPVAVRDLALLPAGGEVLAGVLDNDSDPAGGVLVVQSVSVPDDAGISVSVLGHETLRIADRAQLAEQTTVTYRLSNGKESVEGEVVIIPVPADEKLRPPVANDDEVVVRANDLVTIPVLDNDYHPNDDEIHVAPELVEAPSAEAGQMFVSEDTVRFRASDVAQTVYATYDVVDSTGQKDAGLITIQVVPVDAETNAPPNPPDVTVRALAGETANIPIPLNGIDPDGDSVELVEPASAAKRGTIDEVAVDHLVYRAYDDAAGLDTFTYRVRDALGAEAIGTIRVGVAPAESANQAPYAVTDSLHVRPGRIVAVPVLANDSDPEGKQLLVVPDGLVVPDVDGLEAETLPGHVEITAPGREMETSVQYTIEDEHGARAQGVIQVTVDDEVPLQAPVAKDAHVLPADIQDDFTADVDLRERLSDPDGTPSTLELTADGGELVDPEAGVLRVSIGEERQLIPFTATDEDGLTATAYVHVPARADLRPVRTSTEPVVVQSGETVEIALADHVRSATGDPVVITEAAKVQAGNSDGSPLVRDQQTLVYTSAYRWSGDDAITFEVTDGTSPDDPSGTKATLSIPIHVLPPENEPPEFVDSELTVGAGDGPATLDLAPLASDIDEDDLTFAVAATADAGDVAVSIDGTVLTVEAQPDSAGTERTVSVTVSDGVNDPVRGEVRVAVTASSKPLPVANDDVFDAWNQGETLTVPVLDNDVNPFPETPLELLSATLETGEAEVAAEGDQVVVTPAADFHGTVVVRYRIADATGDQSRMVEGRVRVTVRGVPDAPGKPTVSSVQDRKVALSWTPPSDNGATIAEYVVTSVAGDYEKRCAATTCTLDGLTNNVEYRFTVVAVNEVGASEPSLPSQPARPDARPDQPQAPKLPSFGDRALGVTWETPETPGSPVSSFTLEISPAPPNGISQKTGVTGNKITWEGLENGTAYRVRVRAHNQAPDPSSWSAWSAANIPAAPPAVPAQPSAQMAAPVGDQAQMTVSWTKPATNGDEIDAYQLQVLRGGELVRTVDVPGDQTTQNVTLDTSETDYRFRVQAKNKAGWSGWSTESEPRRAYTAPDAPTNVKAAPHDNSISVSWTPAARNGIKESEISWQYSLNGGAWSSQWSGAANPAGSTIAQGISNGASYTVSIRAVYAATLGTGNGTVASQGSAPSNAVVPFGPVRNPTVDAQRTGDGREITYSWAAPQPNGRDVAMQIRIDGGAWQSVDDTGSTSARYGYSTTHTIEARATDTEGQQSAIVSAKATTVPEAKAWTTQGPDRSAKDEKNCDTDNCEYLVLNTENFPEGDYRATCNDADGAFRDVGVIHIPANGSIYVGKNPHCYFGSPGDTVYVHIEGWGNAQSVVWR